MRTVPSGETVAVCQARACCSDAGSGVVSPALAKPYRFRVRADSEGFPIIPGRYGQIEWFDGRALAVYSDHPKLFRKLWAIANVRRHQTGDREMRAVFPPEALAQVAGVIRARRWGGTGSGRPENFRSGPGQVAASGR